LRDKNEDILNLTKNKKIIKFDVDEACNW
jgi:hypothetical protein